MKVRDVMAKNPITVSLQTPISKLAEIFGKNRIWALYVVDFENQPVGVITRRDLELRRTSKTRRASEIMSRPVYTISPNAPIDDALLEFSKFKVWTLAVTENGKIIGVITRKNIAYAIKNENENLRDNQEIDLHSVLKGEPQPWYAEPRKSFLKPLSNIIIVLLIIMILSNIFSCFLFRLFFIQIYRSEAVLEIRNPRIFMT